LNVYHKEARTAGIFCETVSNSSLLLAAARATGKEFGSHVAADWYFGSRHDGFASRRFALMLYLTYAYGGNWVTVESTLFKTYGFSRNDWEDDFCVRAREIMRSFYRYTCQDSRKGKPDVQLAAVYGNLESIFWMPDDRIPELIDTGDWDDFVWGKWKDTNYRWLWKALESWLPPFEFNDMGKDEWLTRMFTGAPYGQVDVVLPDSNLKNYRAVAFLGWNTMTRKIYDNLLKYVQDGGTLFICGCHLSTRIDLKQEPRIINNGKVKALIGADIVGKGETVFEKFHTCKLKNVTAEEIKPHLLKHKAGKGTVYFFNFYDYPYDFRLVTEIKDILTEIGKQVRDKSDFAIEGEKSKYINYTLWKDGNSRKAYLINVDWENQGNKKIVLRWKGKRYSIVIKDASINKIDLGKLKSGRLSVVPVWEGH
jgi:hypothetical protein